MGLNSDFDYSWLISYTEKQQVIWSGERRVISITLDPIIAVYLKQKKIQWSKSDTIKYEIQGKISLFWNPPFKNTHTAEQDK